MVAAAALAELNQALVWIGFGDQGTGIPSVRKQGCYLLKISWVQQKRTSGTWLKSSVSARKDFLWPLSHQVTPGGHALGARPRQVL